MIQQITSLVFVLLLAVSSAALSPATSKVTVFGGTGYVGSQVCERLVDKGYQVKAISRRGINPRPGTNLDKVTWISGDATNPKDVRDAINDADAIVHAVGLLFDVESGLQGLNTVVSGSKSIPNPETSTYDNITRKTMFNIMDAVEQKLSNPLSNVIKNKSSKKMPIAFVSCAEAGWPDVQFGSFVENNLAPQWLKKYLIAKRAVEDRLLSSSKKKAMMMIRPIIVRPSLIWSWEKLDVLPLIPVFNLANAVGIPFIDKTVRVETLADAIVASLERDDVMGVLRYDAMEALAAKK